MKFIMIVFIALAVASCTTLSKEECQSLNWQERGWADGMKGKTQDTVLEYNQMCMKHGVAVNQEDYLKGRAKGLEVFCTYQSGQQFGRAGETYRGVCPPSLENEFMRGYNIGRKEYELAEKEKELQRRQKQLEEQEASLKAQQTNDSIPRLRACTFNSDCTIEDSCSFGKCKSTGARCTFNSDCATAGRCSSQTVCQGADCQRQNVCKY